MKRVEMNKSNFLSIVRLFWENNRRINYTSKTYLYKIQIHSSYNLLN